MTRTNNIIARASSTVTNGQSTAPITMESGKRFTAGSTYDIYATYNENNNYECSEAIGELEIAKITTATTIVINAQAINVGETTTMSMMVTDSNSQLIRRGTFTVYDGDSIIQSNVQITDYVTSIPLTISTPGAHDIWCIYNDSVGEYNNSISNHVTVQVNKISTTLTTTSTVLLYFGESVTISGTLKSTRNNSPLSNQTVYLLDYDNTTMIANTNTNSNGEFSFTYIPESWDVNNQDIYVKYNGDNTYDTSNSSVRVLLEKHQSTVNLTVKSITVVGEPINITAQVLDENNNLITDGEIIIEVEPEEEE